MVYLRDKASAMTFSDEDITAIDTTTTTAPSPLTAEPGARARELNYQVNSFLAVQINSSSNGALLKPCDDFIILRCLGVEPLGVENGTMQLKLLNPKEFS
jgi:hypothetical protein